MVNFNSVIIGDCKFFLVSCDVCPFTIFAQDLRREVPEVVQLLDKLLVKLGDAKILFLVDRSQDEAANLLQPSSSQLFGGNLERNKDVYSVALWSSVVPGNYAGAVIMIIDVFFQSWQTKTRENRTTSDWLQ